MHLVEKIIESDIPFYAMFGNRKYYFLSFIFAWIRSERLKGRNEDEIIKDLQTHVFPFEVYIDEKYLSTIKINIEIIRQIIQNKYLIKKYLFRNNSKKATLKQLLMEFQEISTKDTQTQDAFLLLRAILTSEYKNKTEQMIHTFGELLTPSFIPSSLSYKMSPGEKETYVYTAAKAHKVIMYECSVQTFVECMIEINKVHPEMKIVRGKQGLSYHLEKKMNQAIIDELGIKLTVS